ncbi:MAG: hypothetical protein AB8F26_11970 [Phycisphaerales bacterium]
MDTPADLTDNLTIHGRLPGERFWWIDVDGRLFSSECLNTSVEDVIARGRVCVEAQIGVIEEVHGRAATLGGLSRGIVDLLWRGHPGVRWAVADVSRVLAKPEQVASA